MRSDYTSDADLRNPITAAINGLTTYKFGFNATVGTTEVTVASHDELVSYPSSASVLKVSSTSANDDVGGTGALTVRIYGLDANYVEQQENVVLTGQTEATTADSYLRVNRMIIQSAGTGEINDGTIYVGDGTVTSGVPATIYCAIQPGDGQSLHSSWTVPEGYTFVLTSGFVSTGGVANTIVTARLVARVESQVWATKDKFLLTREAPANVIYTAPWIVREHTDIEMRATASTGTVDVSASFSGILV